MHPSIKWVLFIICVILSHNPILSMTVLVVLYLLQLSYESSLNEDQGNIEKEYYRPIRNNEHADIGLIYLAAYIMQIESIVHDNQVMYIKRFLSRNFDEEHVNSRMNLLNRLLNMNISYEDGCRRIIYYYEIDDRYKIIDFLFSLAASDGRVSYYEMSAISRIAQTLYVNQLHFERLKNIYYKENESERRQRERPVSFTYNSIETHYTVLGINKDTSADELKSTYRKLVLKYHPDKWISASKIEQEKAKQQFIKIQEAYDKIKDHKGIK